MTGLELINLIKATFDLNCDSLKVICNGKVLKEDLLLISQDIKVLFGDLMTVYMVIELIIYSLKNHSTLMAMCIYDKVTREMAQDSADFKLISDIKEAVCFLSEQRLKGYDIGV